MFRIADWRGKVCSLLFLCFFILMIGVCVWALMFFLILMTCLPWSSFRVFSSFWWCVKSLMLSWASPPLMNHLSEIYFYNPSPFLLHLHLHIFFFKSQIHVNIIIWISSMQCCSSAPCKECQTVKFSKLLNFWKEIDSRHILTGLKHIE